MAVALDGAFTGLKGGVKFENLSALLKLPSGFNRVATTTVNVSVSGKNYANRDKPISVSPSNQPLETGYYTACRFRSRSALSLLRTGGTDLILFG